MITIDPPSSPSTALNKPTLTRFLNRARAAIPLSGSVSVLLTSDAELKRLNRTFRNKNKPTDVLSFPANPIPGIPKAQQHAGDLAISLETAARQAAEHGHPLEAELRILLLHGLLHLSGLDHETDTGQMATRESELRTQLRLPNTLIARTLKPSAAPPAKPPRSPRPAVPRIPEPPSSRPKSSRSEDAVEKCLHSGRISKRPSGRPAISTPALRTHNRQRRTLP